MKRSDYVNSAKLELIDLDTNLPQVFGTEQYNASFTTAINRLNFKGISKEAVYYVTCSADGTGNAPLTYPLDDAIKEVLSVHIKGANDDVEDYQELNGWEVFANALTLNARPSLNSTLKLKTHEYWTVVSDDDATVDTWLDKQAEIVVAIMIEELLRVFINYLIDANNYDTSAKPSGSSLAQVRGWYRDQVSRVDKLVMTYRKPKKPGVINKL